MSLREQILMVLEYVALVFGCAFIGFASVGMHVTLDPPSSFVVLFMGIILIAVLASIFVLKLWDLKHTRRLIL